MVSFIYFSSKQLICSMYDWEAIIHYWWLKNCIGIPKSIMFQEYDKQKHFVRPFHQASNSYFRRVVNFIQP